MRPLSPRFRDLRSCLRQAIGAQSAFGVPHRREYQMNRHRFGFCKLIVALLAMTMMGGCAAHASVSVPYSVEPVRVDIPEGHMPPPGECRIWFPEMPPGQQPPPGDCYELERQVPPGAILVRG